jgi:hypothetical protein
MTYVCCLGAWNIYPYRGAAAQLEPSLALRSLSVSAVAQMRRVQPAAACAGRVKRRQMLARPETVLTLLTLALLAGSALGGCPPKVEQWGVWECTWAAAPSTNPFDAELFVELQPTAGGSGSVTVRGFYDGDGQFKARFMPPTAGGWSWRTRCDTVSALGGHVGAFSVGAASTDNHGPVRAAREPHATTFVHADGTAWHSVGTTVYGLAGSGWGSSAGNTTATLNTLNSTGSMFNKVRMMVSPNSGGDPRFIPCAPQAGVETTGLRTASLNVSCVLHVNANAWTCAAGISKRLEATST